MAESKQLPRDDGTGVTAPAHSGSQNLPNSSRPRSAAGCVDDVSSNESQTCETRMREACRMGGSISGCGTERDVQETSTRRNCRQQAASLRKPHRRAGSRLYTSMSLTALLSACFVCLLPGRASAADVLFFVSVYEWTLVWKDFRNPNYNMGSIWRPKMMSLLNEADPVHFNRSDFPGERNREIDGYDVREYVSESFGVVYFGDVFMIGHEPPNFVGTVIMVDPEGTECPDGLPCFARDKTVAKFRDLLFVTPDKNLFTDIWSAKLKQCTEQTDVKVPVLCSDLAAQKGLCQQETGYAQGEIPITIKRPSCPNDYYVLGHLALRSLNGTNIAEVPMPEYQCIHESLLRKGSWRSAPIFTGSQPSTSPWNPKLINSEWKEPLSLWQVDCRQENCGSDPYCQDSFSAGLFYANNDETMANDQLTDKDNDAPAVGPRCFTMFRDCVGSDGKGTNLQDMNPPWDLISDCDSENGKGVALVGAGQPLRGLFRVLPSGIPNVSPLPVDITLQMDQYICTYISTWNDDLDSGGIGILKVNGVLTEWKSVATVGTFCEVVVTLVLDGTIKPGPARIEIEVQTTNPTYIIIVRDGALPSYPYFRTVGRSIGRLYVYKEPSAGAVIMEPRAVNSNECDLFVLVRFPMYTHAREWNSDIYCNWRQDGMDWLDAEQVLFVRYDHLGIVGIQCYLPRLTSHRLYVQVSFNSDIDGFGSYHDIDASVERFGDPYSVITSDGALRMYGISPISGPEAGGSLITVRGQHFSKYCDSESCNALHCHFRFAKAGGETIYAVDATFVDDKTLKCISPRAVPQVWDVSVEISVDMNPPCSTASDDVLGYNRANFVYQTAQSATAVPDEGVRDRDVASTPFRLQGVWYKCQTNSTLWNDYHVDCAGWVGISQSMNTTKTKRDEQINDLGHYTCLGGFYDEYGEDTSVNYPVWCVRALPLNAATSYLFTLTDPFFNTVASIVRPVPTQYPGYCHRTSHHFGWDRLSYNLDYRYFDVFDKNYSRGVAAVPGKVTQGRNLIDRIWSTTAMEFTIPYMRDVMHEIGEAYGFIDLGTVFSISLDVTLAQTYNEKQLRRELKCAKPPASFASYSGELGDGGASGTFVNWTAYEWENGKASCSVDARWDGNCEQRIVKSPNKEDDTGVMLTKPASLDIKSSVDDEVLGCMRMRVAFDCSSFNKATCVQDLVERDINTARYRNTGSQQEYASFDAWCYFMYPDIAGPNNPERGWNASEPVEPDWRYLFRHSPCVRCQQALELCQALEAVDVVVDGVPGLPQFRTHGDKDAAVEIDLGCFGPESESAVEDQCCDDALDDQPAPTVRGKCPRSLERCVRPANNFLCAKDDDRDGLCSDRATSEWPLCAPRGLV